MRSLQIIRRLTGRERMRIEDIRKEVKVVELRDKIRESRMTRCVKRIEEYKYAGQMHG